jgi:hypothetical protein
MYIPPYWYNALAMPWAAIIPKPTIHTHFWGNGILIAAWIRARAPMTAEIAHNKKEIDNAITMK